MVVRFGYVLVNEAGDIRSAVGRDGEPRPILYELLESAQQVAADEGSRGDGPWVVHYATLVVGEAF